MVLTGVDQLWVADITYIRLREEFVFLAVILDAYSRRVIGWALDRTLEDELTLGRAAHGAVAPRRGAGAGPSLRSRHAVRQQRLHRVCCKATRHRHQHESRKANPWDNAACESFMKTLKYEEVLSQRIPGSGRGARLDPRVPGKGLQPETAALRARLPAAGRVRSQPRRANNKDAASRQLSL